MTLYHRVKALLEKSDKNISDLAGSMKINLGSVSRRLIKGNIDSKLIFALALLLKKSTEEVENIIELKPSARINNMGEFPSQEKKKVNHKNTLLNKKDKNLTDIDHIKQENDDLASIVVDFSRINNKLTEENKNIKRDIAELIKEKASLDHMISTLQSENKYLKKEFENWNNKEFPLEEYKQLIQENKNLKEEIQQLKLKLTKKERDNELSCDIEILNIMIKNKDQKIKMLEQQIEIFKDNQWTKHKS